MSCSGKTTAFRESSRTIRAFSAWKKSKRILASTGDQDAVVLVRDKDRFLLFNDDAKTFSELTGRRVSRTKWGSFVSVKRTEATAGIDKGQYGAMGALIHAGKRVALLDEKETWKRNAK